MAIKIHGKDYVTVDERVRDAHKDCKTLSITTEVLPIADKIVIKATVTTPKGVFTGISAANDAKLIEKQSPYEVAETSAVGRALGFAGYGIVNGIATAEEMAKVKGGTTFSLPKEKLCVIHKVPIYFKKEGEKEWYQHFIGSGIVCYGKEGQS